ncbi:MAG: DUF3090 family protein [Chloroflexi bacterium]|nr:MAG: DUF3090 family protein [Chloroflexota bacterium]
MPRTEIDLNPVDFITIDTIGPKGKRVFYLQAGKDGQLVSFVIEKEQAWALGEAIKELVDDLDARFNETTEVDISKMDMNLREPIEPLFRISQMGLGFDEERQMVVLVAQELVIRDGAEEAEEPGVVRMWCTREQMRALAEQALETVKSGRADPKQNGRLVYYWT